MLHDNVIAVVYAAKILKSKGGQMHTTTELDRP